MKKTTFDTLTPARRAELAALAAIPEDQINTSDLPEQRDWSGARRGLFSPHNEFNKEGEARGGAQFVTANEEGKQARQQGRMLDHATSVAACDRIVETESTTTDLDREELTIQAAADLLNVSRPYVVRLLDEGRIPSHRVGEDQRVLVKDVLAYRDEQYSARKSALDRLSDLDQDLGLT